MRSHRVHCVIDLLIRNLCIRATTASLIHLRFTNLTYCILVLQLHHSCFFSAKYGNCDKYLSVFTKMTSKSRWNFFPKQSQQNTGCGYLYPNICLYISSLSTRMQYTDASGYKPSKYVSTFPNAKINDDRNKSCAFSLVRCFHTNV